MNRRMAALLGAISPKRTATVLAFAALTLCPSASVADNPVVQTNHTADPAPLVYDGRIYLYTGHDEDTLVNNFFPMNEWPVYSSADIVNWTDHGVTAALLTLRRGRAHAGPLVGLFASYAAPRSLRVRARAHARVPPAATV